MFVRYAKQAVMYGLIVGAGLGSGWAIPRVMHMLKPAYTTGDYAAYYAGTRTDVIVYGTSTCPYCRKTREYLTAHHIAFTDVDVFGSAKGKHDFPELGGTSVPVVLIGQRRINGFNPDALQAALAAAGHPLLN